MLFGLTCCNSVDISAWPIQASKYRKNVSIKWPCWCGILHKTPGQDQAIRKQSSAGLRSTAMVKCTAGAPAILAPCILRPSPPVGHCPLMKVRWRFRQYRTGQLAFVKKCRMVRPPVVLTCCCLTWLALGAVAAIPGSPCLCRQKQHQLKTIPKR